MQKLLGKVVAAQPADHSMLPEPYAVTRVTPAGTLYLVCIKGGFYSASLIAVTLEGQHAWRILGHYEDDAGIAGAIDSLEDLLTSDEYEIDDRIRSQMQVARRGLVDALEASTRAQALEAFKKDDGKIAERRERCMSKLTREFAELRTDPINPPAVNERLWHEMTDPDLGVTEPSEDTLPDGF